MITNSGSQRFNIYSGPFTKNDQLTVSPFTNFFLYVPNITFSVATKVLPTLNNAGANNRRALGILEEREREAYSLGYVDTRYMGWLEDMDRRHWNERRATTNETLGYVTHDVCPRF